MMISNNPYYADFYKRIIFIDDYGYKTRIASIEIPKHKIECYTNSMITNYAATIY